MLSLLGSGDGSDPAGTILHFCKSHSGLIPKLLIVMRRGAPIYYEFQRKAARSFALNKGPISTSEIKSEDILIPFIQPLRAPSLMAPINSGCC